MTIPNVVLTATLDRRVRGDDLKVYIFLYTQLDVLAYRPVKHSWLARRVTIARPNVVRALRRLLELGYVVQGRPEAGLNTYRLAMSPPDVAAPQRRTAHHA